jgi:hypothetical protein
MYGDQLITQGSNCMPWLTASNEIGSTIAMPIPCQKTWQSWNHDADNLTVLKGQLLQWVSNTKMETNLSTCPIGRQKNHLYIYFPHLNKKLTGIIWQYFLRTAQVLNGGKLWHPVLFRTFVWFHYIYLLSQNYSLVPICIILLISWCKEEASTKIKKLFLYQP